LITNKIFGLIITNLRIYDLRTGTPQKYAGLRLRNEPKNLRICDLRTTNEICVPTFGFTKSCNAQERRLSLLDLAILHVLVLRHLQTVFKSAFDAATGLLMLSQEEDASSREEMHSVSSGSVSPPPDLCRSFEEAWAEADANWHLTAGFSNLEWWNEGNPSNDDCEMDDQRREF
jgi:hypothetical protein